MAQREACENARARAKERRREHEKGVHAVAARGGKCLFELGNGRHFQGSRLEPHLVPCRLQRFELRDTAGRIPQQRDAREPGYDLAQQLEPFRPEVGKIKEDAGDFCRRAGRSWR